METLRRRFLVTVSLFMLMVAFLFVPTMTGKAEDATPTEPTPPTETADEWKQPVVENVTVHDVSAASITINSVEDLYGVSAWITGNANESLIINLNADITVNDCSLNDNTDALSVINWTPIDTISGKNVTFNGNKHIISGLYVNGGDYAGLFGHCEGKVEVSELGMINSYFKADTAAGTIAAAVGGNSVVSNCYSNNCIVDATTKGSIVAVLEGTDTVKNSFSYSADACVGTVGSGNVTNCYYLGNTSTDTGTQDTMIEADVNIGKVTYQLSQGQDNSPWGQKIYADCKTIPVFSADKVNYIQTSCSAQGKVYTNIDAAAAEHQLQKYDAADKPCEDTHDAYYRCENCGKYFKEADVEGLADGASNLDLTGYAELDSTNFNYTEGSGHTLKYHAAKAVTCTEDGNVAYYSCTNVNCKFVLYFDESGNLVQGGEDFDPTIESTGHTFGETKIVAENYTEDTNADAYKKHVHRAIHVCTKCGAVEEDETVTDGVGTITVDDEYITIIKEGCTATSATYHYVCADCGYVGEGTITVAAGTHTAVLYANEQGHWRVCSVCNQIIDALANHTEVTIAAKDPTCTEAGNTEGKYCSDCGYVIVKHETIPAIGHVWGAWETTKDETCTQDGEEERTCLLCGEKETQVRPNKGGHDWQDVKGTPATCTEAGVSDYKKCSKCGEEIGKTTLAATGHAGEAVPGKKPTCTETGLEDGIWCPLCEHWIDGDGNIVEAPKELPVIDHTEEAIPDKEATCTENGTTGGKRCSVCGEILEEPTVVPASHKGLTVTTVPASCTEKGSITRTCTECGLNETVEIPMLSHSYVNIAAKAPTCTEDGHAEYLGCDHCGTPASGEIPVIEALGHKLQHFDKEYTCTDGGHEAYDYCSVCKKYFMNGEEVEQAATIIEAKDSHTNVVEEEAKAATCTEAGWNAWSHCADCGAVITAKQEIEALGHDFEGGTQTVVNPTCTKGGYTETKCSRCDEVQISNETAATGHTYSTDSAVWTWTVDENGNLVPKVVLTCSACASEPEEGNTKELSAGILSQMKDSDGNLVVTAVSSYNGTQIKGSITLTKSAEEWKPVDDGFEVTMTFTSEDGVSIAKKAEVTATFANNVLTYTAKLVITANLAEYTSTKTFEVSDIQYSWSKTADGYSLVAVANGKAENDVALRLVQAATKEDVTNEAGEVVSTKYTATIIVGGVELKTDTKTVANKTYTITLQGEATFENHTGTSIEVSYFDLVTVICGTVDGKQFAGWYINDELVSTKETYSFYVKDTVTLEARFSENAVEAQPILSFSVGNRVDLEDTGKQTIAVAVDWEIPQGYTLKEAGFRRIYIEQGSAGDNATSAEQTLKDNGTGVKSVVSSLKTSSGTLTSTLTLSATTKVNNMYTIAYIVYTDASGNEHTMYSKCIISSYSVNA